MINGYAATESELINFRKIAERKHCDSIIRTVTIDKLDKIILSAGLMTNSKLLLGMIHSNYGELTQFVEDVVVFCRLIPDYSFKDITDKMLQ